jgi:hypothetical protein
LIDDAACLSLLSDVCHDDMTKWMTVFTTYLMN